MYIIPKCHSTYKSHVNYKLYHWHGLIQRIAGLTVPIIQETKNSEVILRLSPQPHPNYDLKFWKLLLCNRTYMRKRDRINFGLQIADPTVQVIEKTRNCWLELAVKSFLLGNLKLKMQ